MKVKVSEIKYKLDYPTEFIFEIDDEICADDANISKEVSRLIKEETGLQISECTVDLEE